jgi:hypothetical protein
MKSLHPHIFRDSILPQNQCISEHNELERGMGVCQGVATDSLKYHPGLPCPTFLRSESGPPLKGPYDRFMGGPHARRLTCSHLLPLWTPRAVRIF